MEIEINKQSFAKKRKAFQITNYDSPSPYTTPLKQVKVERNYLTNTEKSYAYLKHKEGKDASTISKALGRDTRTVRAFISSAKNRKSFLPNHENKGRFRRGTTMLNERQKRLLTEWAREGKITSAREGWLRLLKLKNLPKVSYSTVNRFLNMIGSFVKPKLQTIISPINVDKRLCYIKKYRNFNFKQVLFSDESSFQLNGNTIRAFKAKGEAAPIKAKFNPNHTVMVWGGICWYGKTSLYFVKGTLDAPKYLKLLQSRRKEMLALYQNKGPWHFLQDGAPCHRPQRVANYINKYLTQETMPHPPQSPDMNAIEMVWAIVKRKVEKLRPNNKEQLKEAIKTAWDQIELKVLQSCIQHIPKAMDKIEKNKGQLV